MPLVVLLVSVLACGSDPDPHAEPDAGIADAGPDGGPPVCTLDETAPCYDGDPAHDGVGSCVRGVHVCIGPPTNWTRCVGWQSPGLESCTNAADDDCDGAADAADPECASACPAGPPANDTCAQAARIAAFGTYAGTTAGANDDIHHLEREGMCTPPDPAPDVVYFVDLPRGTRWDVYVDDAGDAPVEFRVRGMETCMDPPPEGGGCGVGFGSHDGPYYLTVEPTSPAATCFTLTIAPVT